MGAVEVVEAAGGGGGGGTATGPAVAPASLAFGSVVVGSTSLPQTVTLTNTTTALSAVTFTPSAGFARSTTSPGTCTTTLAASASCTYNVVFTPTTAAAANGTLTVAATAGTAPAVITGSPVALTGTGTAAPALPALAVLDNFNRATATSLGASWTQLALLGTAAIQVSDVTAGNTATGTAFCNNTGAIPPCGLGGIAFWTTPAFGAKEGAAFTIANATLTNDALILAASGTPLASVYPNYVRVLISGGTATVATTTNAGLAYTAAGSVALPAGATFANGDTVTAVIDGSTAVAAPTVYIWRTTSANLTTYLGSVQITPNALWQAGGRVGVQLPAGARVDNFAGATVP